MSQQFSDFTRPTDPPPPPKRNSAKMILLGILGGVTLLIVLLCCGAGLWVMDFGMSVVSADIERQLRDHPQIRENVGELETLEVNWPHSLAHEDENTFVYDITGSKESGQITVESISQADGSEEIVSAELRLTDGETVELDLE